MEEHICPCCGKEMQDHSKPCRPFWVCEECSCDESGIELEFCENCGDYIDSSYGECECSDYEDEEDD